MLEVAPALGEHWLLIGGQMVFLHEVERDVSGTRPTDDVDVVVDVRVSPRALTHIHGVLCGAGFVQSMPSIDGIAHRYGRGGATIDVLAPDNLAKRASLALGSYPDEPGVGCQQFVITLSANWSKLATIRQHQPTPLIIENMT